MKKNSSFNLEELAKVMPVLTEKEQSTFIGGDRYLFNRSGKLVGQEEDPNNYFTIVEYNKDKDEYIEKASMGINGEVEQNHQLGTGYMFEGSGMNVDVFKFMADNTTVEWGLSTSGDSTGFLITSNDSTFVNTPLFDGGGYDKHYHSHPGYGTQGFSDDDKKAAVGFEKNGYRQHYLYTPQTQKLIEYDRDGRKINP